MKLFLLAIIASGLMGGWLLTSLQNWGKQPIEVGEPVTLDFPRGTTLKALAIKLENLELVADAQKFHFFVKIFDQYPAFKAGQYRFSGSVSPVSIARKIRGGEIYEPIVLQITIPEGFTLKQIVDRLVRLEVGSRADIMALMKSRDFLEELNIPSQSLEGYIYPATYAFRRKRPAREILEHMVETFWKRLPPNYQARIADKKLNLNEAVTFASLIELETQHEDEKNKIAEVIWRRLKAGEPLAIDAALIYGIKDYKGDIKWVHLKDRQNPYNTRIHKGLPPGPIGSPSASSLEAVLNPTNGGYYYYVLVPDGRNRHHFSTSLSEHNRHVKLLIDSSRKRRLNSERGK